MRTATKIRIASLDGCVDTEEVFEALSHLSGTLQDLSLDTSGTVSGFG